MRLCFDMKFLIELLLSIAASSTMPMESIRQKIRFYHIVSQKLIRHIDMILLKQYIHMTLQLNEALSISGIDNYILYRLRQLRTELGMNHKRSHFLYWHIKSMSMNN